MLCPQNGPFFNTDSVLPPDPNGDVGPNHYVQWVNPHFTIYNKSGVKVYGPAEGSSREAAEEHGLRLCKDWIDRQP